MEAIHESKNSEEVTFDNIAEIGKLVESSTVKNGNNIIPSDLYFYKNNFYRKVDRTWLAEGYVYEIIDGDEHDWYLGLYNKQ